MGSVFEFFGEYVAGIDLACDMTNIDVVVNDGLANFAFFEIDVFHAFVGEGAAPTNCGFIIVVDVNAFESIWHVEILGAEFDVEEIGRAFVGGDDLSFT